MQSRKNMSADVSVMRKIKYIANNIRNAMLRIWIIAENCGHHIEHVSFLLNIMIPQFMLYIVNKRTIWTPFVVFVTFLFCPRNYYHHIFTTLLKRYIFLVNSFRFIFLRHVYFNFGLRVDSALQVVAIKLKRIC